MKKRTNIVIILIIMAAAIVIFPLFWLGSAEFEGSDSAGSEMVHVIAGEEYEPWANPILERFIGAELPAEMETLFFCIQTGIGVGVIAYCFGYLAAKKKYCDESADKKQISDIETTMQGT